MAKVGANNGKRIEHRIRGVRGLVLHILPSGVGTSSNTFGSGSGAGVGGPRHIGCAVEGEVARCVARLAARLRPVIIDAGGRQRDRRKAVGQFAGFGALLRHHRNALAE